MTTKITITADIPEYQRETHHVRVGYWNVPEQPLQVDQTCAEAHHVKLKHGETTEGYVYGGRRLTISEEPD